VIGSQNKFDSAFFTNSNEVYDDSANVFDGIEYS